MKTVQESNLIQESEEKEDRKIGCMLHVVQGDISDQMTLRRVPWSGDRAIRIDAIVNAAKPTLMGSDKGVDGAIHRKIDELLKRKAEAERSLVKTFNDMICEEIDVKDGLGAAAGPSGRIRCRRGQAVITKGYGLCDYVIHVVGSIFDGEKIEAGECLQDQRKKFKTCSSSRVRTLESCYREIVRVIREHPDIKNVAVPIISSGTYGFPFEMAADIAIATIGNALLEWQQEDGEYFNDTREGLQNIFFFICPRDEEKFEIVSGILAQYSQAINLNEWYGFAGLVILVSWQQIGYMMIVYIAGLQSIPTDVLEAAEVDGAGPWERLKSVIIPMMMPSITICTFLSITNGFKLFDQNLSLTAGEPSKLSELLALNIYNTFYGRTGWEGVGQAKAVIFCLVVVAIGLIQLRVTRSKEVQQ